MNAMVERSEIYEAANTFFLDFDLILTPATVVPPYPVEQRFVQQVGDHEFANYIEWCSIAYALPSLALRRCRSPADLPKAGCQWVYRLQRPFAKKQDCSRLPAPLRIC